LVVIIGTYFVFIVWIVLFAQFDCEVGDIVEDILVYREETKEEKP